MQLQRSLILLAAAGTTLLTFVSSCVPGEYECSSFQDRTKCLTRSQLCDSNKDCHWGDDEDKCDVIPDVSFYCTNNYPKDGYYKGKKVTCTCNVRTEDLDVHKGFAQWLKDGSPKDKPLRSITLMVNSSEANQGYSCSGQSGYGNRDKGKPLEPKFAYLDEVMVTLSPPLITFCNRDNPPEVTCKIPKENVNPAPTFTFRADGVVMGGALPAIETDIHYEQMLTISKKGTMQISCTVTNTIFLLTREVIKLVTLREPPSQPPTVMVAGQSFQGTSSINIAILEQNYTGNLTCTVSGGYPEPRIGSLACGDNIGFSDDTKGMVRFQNAEVLRAMHDVYCSCIAEHDSDCYSNSETKVKISVVGLASTKKQSGMQDENQDGKEDGNQNIVMIAIPVLLAVIIVMLIVVIVILVLRQKRQHQEQGTQAERVQLHEQKA